jgi:hypothetical protein
MIGFCLAAVEESDQDSPARSMSLGTGHTSPVEVNSMLALRREKATTGAMTSWGMSVCVEAKSLTFIG